MSAKGKAPYGCMSGGLQNPTLDLLARSPHHSLSLTRQNPRRYLKEAGEGGVSQRPGTSKGVSVLALNGRACITVQSTTLFVDFFEKT